MLYEQDFGVSSSKTFFIFFPVCKNVFIIIVADGVGGGNLSSSPFVWVPGPETSLSGLHDKHVTP